MRGLVIAGVLAIATPALSQAVAPTPGTDGASNERRYSFSRSGDAFIRLDNVTGQVAFCEQRVAGWVCVTAPEEREAFEKEIARLQDENGALKQQLAARHQGEGETAQAPKGSRVPEPQLRLPTNEDVNRAVALAGKIWRRLLDMMADIQKDVREKI
jgi:hypothetical protein